MRNVLIIGGDSTIGSTLNNYFTNKNTPCTITTRRKTEASNTNKIYFDLSNPTTPNLKGYTHAIICACIPSFEKCEKDPNYTKKINIDATLSLINHLLESSCKVVYLSSSAVFDGTTNAPNELTPTSPTTEYGRQKAYVEKFISELHSNISVVRLTKVATSKLNIISRAYLCAKNNQPCEVFNNLYISPISLPYVCNSLNRIIFTEKFGIFHLSNKEHISYSEFIKNLIKHSNLNENHIIEIPATQDFLKSHYNNLGMHITNDILSIKPEELNDTIKHVTEEYNYI